MLGSDTISGIAPTKSGPCRCWEKPGESAGNDEAVLVPPALFCRRPFRNQKKPAQMASQPKILPMTAPIIVPAPISLFAGVGVVTALSLESFESFALSKLAVSLFAS